MTVVLDVSLAVGILTGNPSAAPFESPLIEADEVLAPDLFVAELSNAVWKMVRAGQISAQAGSELIRDGLDMVDEFVPVLAIWEKAFDNAVVSDHPVYDMVYLTLARLKSASLLTLDKKLARLVRS